MAIEDLLKDSYGRFFNDAGEATAKARDSINETVLDIGTRTGVFQSIAEKLGDLRSEETPAVVNGEAELTNKPPFMGGELKDSSWVRQVMFIPRIDVAVSFKNARAKHILRNREYTEGVVNFADTTLGGNRSINPKPQFTEFADQNVDTLLPSVSSNANIGHHPKGGVNTGGMGREYYESIDQFAERIYMDFGVPQFNSLGNFFSKFYDYKQGKLANTGVVDAVLYSTGRVLGYVYLWPIIIPLRGMFAVADIWNFLTRQPTSRYYYMKPTMDVYWSMVTTIVNAMSVNMGLIPGYDPQAYGSETAKKYDIDPDGKAGLKGNMAPGLSDADFEAYQRILPDIFRNKNGGIDPRAVATRYQRLANAQQDAMEAIVKGADSMEDIYAKIMEAIKGKQIGQEQPLSENDMRKYIEGYSASVYATGKYNIEYGLPPEDETQQMNAAMKLEQLAKSSEEDINKNTEGVAKPISPSDLNQKTSATRTPEEIAAAANADRDALIAATNNLTNLTDKEKADRIAFINSNYGDDALRKTAEAGAVDDFRRGANAEGVGYNGIIKSMFEQFDFFRGTVRDGAAWVSFCVDHQKGISESFSNSTRTSSIAEQMNQKSSESRNLVFNLAGGNIGDNPLAGILEFTANGIKSLVNGVASSVGLSGLNALGGAAYVDIPDFWDNSSCSLPSNSYTIQLRSPYGNPMSLLINIYFPLAMILAGGVPRSTGLNSYTGPFLCRLWHKGRTQVGLGLITDINITRGNGGIGWNMKDQATAIDVTFTVTNLSKMLHMPISAEISALDIFGMNMFNESNNFTDYMATLAGLGLPEQFYHFPNLKRQNILSQTNWDTWFSTTNFDMKIVHGTLPGYIMNAVARDATFF